MHGTFSSSSPGRRFGGTSRRRFLGLLTVGAATVGAAATGQAARASDRTAVGRTYTSQDDIDRRARALAAVLAAADPAAVAAWITGTGSAPEEIRTELDTQITAFADAAATGTGTPRDAVIVSRVRAASTQRLIWDRKYEFLRTGSGGAGTFGIITDEVRAAYPEELGTEPQWDPDTESHRSVWAGLTSGERQIEILRTSTAPGVSRHHLGSDVDFFNTTPQDWTDDGPEAARYAWLRANAARHGFLQTYTRESAASRPAISEERWHWSYAPVTDAVLDHISENEPAISDALDTLWAYDPARFTHIRANWRGYMFHVNRKAHFG